MVSASREHTNSITHNFYNKILSCEITKEKKDVYSNFNDDSILKRLDS